MHANGQSRPTAVSDDRHLSSRLIGQSGSAALDPTNLVVFRNVCVSDQALVTNRHEALLRAQDFDKFPSRIEAGIGFEPARAERCEV